MSYMSYASPTVPQAIISPSLRYAARKPIRTKLYDLRRLMTAFIRPKCWSEGDSTAHPSGYRDKLQSPSTCRPEDVASVTQDVRWKDAEGVAVFGRVLRRLAFLAVLVKQS